MTALQVRYYFHWDVVWRHVHRLYGGLFLGLELAVVALFIGSLIGLGGAFARTSRSRVLRAVFAAYVEFIRNVPLLLLIYFAYFGLPKVGISFLNNVSSFVMALAIYSGAFLTEVFRAGIGSIPTGYIEAGKAIGLTRLQNVRHVVLPVMFRIVLPSLSNTFISLFKDTALASAIAVPELTYGAVWINVNTFRVVETWTVVAAMYLVTGYAIALGLRRVERRYAVIR